MVVRIFLSLNSNLFLLFSKAINKVYGCVIQRKDHLINKETGRYDEEEFIRYPDKYTSTFKTKVSY
jgi:hypothetical protein